jgi:hypothetical protein
MSAQPWMEGPHESYDASKNDQETCKSFLFKTVKNQVLYEIVKTTFCARLFKLRDIDHARLEAWTPSVDAILLITPTTL